MRNGDIKQTSFARMLKQLSTTLVVVVMVAVASPAAPTTPEKPSPAPFDSASLAKATPAQIKVFFNSAEYKNLHTTDAQFLEHAFRAILQREPDRQGFNNWTTAMKKNAENPKFREKVVQAFLNSPEYSALHPVKQAVVLPKKDTKRNSANVLFNKTGVFVNDAHALPADRYAPLFKKAKIAWLALQIDNGGNVRADNVAAIKAGWLNAWRKEGFKVGFWGCPRGANQHDSQAAVAAAIPLVQKDAELGVKLTAKYGGDLYIANCEAHYQSFSANDPTPALNRVYVDAFRLAADAAGIGKLPRALSSMGRVALDMQPWIEDGWDVLPQAYWNSYAVYQPSLCVDFYEKETGWPIERVHPTIATYPGEGEKRSVSLQDYAVDLKKRATVGFSYYLPESYLHFDASAYEQLAGMAAPVK